MKELYFSPPPKRCMAYSWTALVFVYFIVTTTSFSDIYIYINLLKTEQLHIFLRIYEVLLSKCSHTSVQDCVSVYTTMVGFSNELSEINSHSD